MAKVHLLIKKDSISGCAIDPKTILGVFSTSEKAADAANEYIIKEWKDHCEEYSYRCPKTPLTYDDIHCSYWTFRSDFKDYSSIKIVDYDLDCLGH